MHTQGKQAELLSKLREQSEWYGDGHGPLHKEAADEIERLRRALRDIATACAGVVDDETVQGGERRAWKAVGRMAMAAIGDS